MIKSEVPEGESVFRAIQIRVEIRLTGAHNLCERAASTLLSDELQENEEIEGGDCRDAA